MLNVVRSSSLASVTVRSVTRSTCIAGGQSVVTIKEGDCIVLVRSLASGEVLKRWTTTVVAADQGFGSVVRVAPAVQFGKTAQRPTATSLNATVKLVTEARAALVVGHAAILTGNTMQNRILSKKRALHVADVLRQQANIGIVEAIGVGGDVPVSRLLTETQQRANRRVIVYYVP